VVGIETLQQRTHGGLQLAEGVGSRSLAIDEIMAGPTEEVLSSRRGVELAQRLVAVGAEGEAGLLAEDDALATLGAFSFGQ
jgi:hypothetical protein